MMFLKKIRSNMNRKKRDKIESVIREEAKLFISELKSKNENLAAIPSEVIGVCHLDFSLFGFYHFEAGKVYISAGNVAAYIQKYSKIKKESDIRLFTRALVSHEFGHGIAHMYQFNLYSSLLEKNNQYKREGNFEAMSEIVDRFEADADYYAERILRQYDPQTLPFFRYLKDLPSVSNPQYLKKLYR